MFKRLCYSMTGYCLVCEKNTVMDIVESKEHVGQKGRQCRECQSIFCDPFEIIEEKGGRHARRLRKCSHNS